MYIFNKGLGCGSERGLKCCQQPTSLSCTVDFCYSVSYVCTYTDDSLIVKWNVLTHSEL